MDFFLVNALWRKAKNTLNKHDATRVYGNPVIFCETAIMCVKAILHTNTVLILGKLHCHEFCTIRHHQCVHATTLTFRFSQANRFIFSNMIIVVRSFLIRLK